MQNMQSFFEMFQPAKSSQPISTTNPDEYSNPFASDALQIPCPNQLPIYSPNCEHQTGFNFQKWSETNQKISETLNSNPELSVNMLTQFISTTSPNVLSPSVNQMSSDSFEPQITSLRTLQQIQSPPQEGIVNDVDLRQPCYVTNSRSTTLLTTNPSDPSVIGYTIDPNETGQNMAPVAGKQISSPEFVVFSQEAAMKKLASKKENGVTTINTTSSNDKFEADEKWSYYETGVWAYGDNCYCKYCRKSAEFSTKIEYQSNILFVAEHNMAGALEYTMSGRRWPNERVIATDLVGPIDPSNHLHPGYQNWVKSLTAHNIEVRFGIDMRNLDQYFKIRLHHIQCNRPYIYSKDANRKEFQNIRNRDLLPGLFRSARKCQEVGDTLTVGLDHTKENTCKSTENRQAEMHLVEASLRAGYRLLSIRVVNLAYQKGDPGTAGTSQCYNLLQEFLFCKTEQGEHGLPELNQISGVGGPSKSWNHLIGEAQAVARNNFIIWANKIEELFNKQLSQLHYRLDQLGVKGFKIILSGNECFTRKNPNETISKYYAGLAYQKT